MHLKRLIIALIFIPLFYLYVAKLSPAYFLLLLIIVGAAAQYEFYLMYKVTRLFRYIGIIFGTLILCFAYFSSYSFLNLFAFLLIAFAVLRLFYRKDPVSSLKDMAAPIIGVIYIPLLLSFQIFLRRWGYEWIFLLYGSVWLSDSLAYYVGSGIGKRKLYPEISPNKTIAGAVGSSLGGILGAVILKAIFMSLMNVSYVQIAILGFVVGSLAVIGDLVESMFKRDAGVKDSSNILPGHGGVLDKIDSVLFAGPALYWLLIMYIK